MVVLKSRGFWTVARSGPTNEMGEGVEFPRAGVEGRCDEDLGTDRWTSVGPDKGRPRGHREKECPLSRPMLR